MKNEVGVLTVADRKKRGFSALVRSILLLSLCFSLVSCSSREQKEADECYWRAIKAIKEEKHEQVIAELTRALQLTNDGKPTLHANNNQDGNWTMWRARAYEKLGCFEEAISDYSKSIELAMSYLHSTHCAATPELYYKEKCMRKFSGYYEERANAYLKVMNMKAAVTDYKQAVAILEKGLNVPLLVLKNEEQQMLSQVMARYKSELEKVQIQGR